MTADVGEIRHLLSRTGFGVPRQAELDALTGLDYSDAVTSVLDSWQPRSTPHQVGRREKGSDGLREVAHVAQTLAGH